MSSVLHDLFNLSFFQNVVTTALGVAIGIPAALFVNRKMQRQQERSNEKSLLAIIDETIAHNLALMKDVVAGGNFGMENHPDLTLLESTAALKYDVLKDPVVLRGIDQLRSELVHIDRMIGIYYNALFSAGTMPLAMQEDRKFAINDAKAFGDNVVRDSIVPFIEDAERFREFIRPFLK